jgi:2-dehydro-3-deoxyphosphogluconate aldolase / (4S)-4-hydroxy-2-oxoglutarate aldolase
MARFKRLEVLQAMVHTGVVPVFYNGDVETAASVVRACADGGARVVEFTNRGDGALAVFTELEKRFARERPEVILGAGSIVDAPTAALYVSAGANFIVGPVLSAEIARLCNRRKVAYSPGCGTPSEISAAEELGVEIVKIFPGKEVGGPGFVKNMLGPCPWTSLMPTGGVEATQESLQAWFAAGVACVGMGSNLITREALAAGDFAGLARQVAQVIAWIKAIRSPAI